MPEIPDWAESLHWSQSEYDMFESAALGDAYDDRLLQTLYHEAFFNFDNSGVPFGNTTIMEAFREELRAYVEREYGIDWDEHFDWDAWREAYAEAAQ